MSSDRVTAVAFVAAAAELAELDCDPFNHDELLEVLGELETVTWRLPVVGHRIIARLQREASPVALGATSLKGVLAQRLRISGRDAARRLAEATLVRIVGLTGPEVLRRGAERLATAIDQDGPEPDDTERARTRFLRLGRQRADGMTPVTGLLDPQARATWEPILAKLAAPYGWTYRSRVGGVGSAQRPAGHGDRVDHPARPGIRQRIGGHRRGVTRSCRTTSTRS